MSLGNAAFNIEIRQIDGHLNNSEKRFIGSFSFYLFPRLAIVCTIVARSVANNKANNFGFLHFDSYR